MRHLHSFVLYSDGFYTSPFGYKLCLRCNVAIEQGEEYLALYVHVMKGENDDSLKWPLQVGHVKIEPNYKTVYEHLVLEQIIPKLVPKLYDLTFFFYYLDNFTDFFCPSTNYLKNSRRIMHIHKNLGTQKILC
jgi:hypothetical protein